MKFTDEELSTIMDAHESKKLSRYGQLCANRVCLFMAAKGTEDEESDEKGWALKEWYRHAPFDIVVQNIEWFDRNYNPGWTVDEFLAQLEAEGLA